MKRHCVCRLDHKIRNVLAAAVIFCLAVVMPARVPDAQEAQEAQPSAVSADSDDQSTSGTKKKAKKDKKKRKIVPIPIFITEPAIGVGLGAAVGYFHKKPQDPESESSIPRAMTTQTPGESTRTKKPPPTITGVAAAYTDSGTWGGGIGHTRSNRKDSIRYVGALGYANVKSTIYRSDIPFDFDIKGTILIQNVKFRVGKSNFFLGAKAQALFSDAKIQTGEEQPVELGEGETNNVGLAALSIWDTRDNVMTPNQGQIVELDLWRYDDAFGGDFDYWNLNFKVNSFHELNDRFILGWRIDAKAADGDPPFWGYPWVTLRGVPALRYQNERVGVAEIEVRYQFAKRWGAVAFFGGGATSGDSPKFETADDIYAGGVGGRFLFIADEDLWVGIDVARGPEDTYWYIQVGQAW